MAPHSIILIEYRGRRWLLSELVKITGIPRTTICKRLTDGWTVEQALGHPTPTQRRAGVVSNLEAFEGTGAGGTAQETPNLTFSGFDA
ncbi:hypothetical protein SAMN05880582_101207 [Rhizobium sp. RU20A]|uniref:hypothetical protein n=1 Tax=Rhizobium sp. RU20A TaxID=1907412 RepID=UPI000954EB39|nr:hypothetical protein [Rhizobium sp. RU20A]SIP96901.1 hypothetical protein SAMN05880582_101207 [Rhizobium sp. RU20A]